MSQDNKMPREEVMETADIYGVVGNIILTVAVCLGPYLIPGINVEWETPHRQE